MNGPLLNNYGWVSHFANSIDNNGIDYEAIFYLTLVKFDSLTELYLG